ncbi:hypothetical protein [Streptomyces sp. 7N604]|uniref:hypothetical protein n=1 Tax=Streptomyces sp. 7N604 TaxID=3457415 RepID=UPI003FD334DC
MSKSLENVELETVVAELGSEAIGLHRSGLEVLRSLLDVVKESAERITVLEARVKELQVALPTDQR